MKQPEKWRETCDPFALPYRSYRPLEILGYPHAGNDVFYTRGSFRGEEVFAYVKAARQKGAAIENEVRVLSHLQAPAIPRLIDYGFGNPPFSVTLELPGERLSAILGNNEGLASLAYLPAYGEALAGLHALRIPADMVADRRFFHAPSPTLLAETGVEELADFFASPPADPALCFCHGDFHYANVLWQGRQISAMLDFELAGRGIRDFDIAWALFLRPGQNFMKTTREQQAFLDGYARRGTYDPEAVRYYMAQCLVYFLAMTPNDLAYGEAVRSWLRKLGSEETRLH